MEMIDVLKKLEEIALTKPELVRDAVDNVTRTNPAAVQDNAVKTDEGGMSDVHIGAQEVIGQYADEDGNLKMPKMDVLRAMAAEKEKAAFPLSYEIEVAMGIVNEKFGNDGIAKADMDMNSEQPAVGEDAGDGGWSSAMMSLRMMIWASSGRGGPCASALLRQASRSAGSALRGLA